MKTWIRFLFDDKKNNKQGRQKEDTNFNEMGSIYSITYIVRKYNRLCTSSQARFEHGKNLNHSKIKRSAELKRTLLRF